jgi:hypothetical protein
MKDAILQQYTAIRETIKANVDTIGRLLKQADSLKRIAGTLPDEKTRTDLEKQITQIEATITTLISQTDDLFEQYNKFVETVFSK